MHDLNLSFTRTGPGALSSTMDGSPSFAVDPSHSELPEVPYEQPRFITELPATELNTLARDFHEDPLKAERKAWQAQAAATEGVERLKERAANLPEGDHYRPIREHLQTLETNGRAINELLTGRQPVSVQDSLQIMQKVMVHSQNFELTAKIVEQITSGVRRLFEMQV